MSETDTNQIMMDLLRAAIIAVVQNVTVAVAAFGVLDLTTEQSGIIIALVNNVLTFAFLIWSIVRTLQKPGQPGGVASTRRTRGGGTTS